jgi:glycyl-tRNA synthetase beta chain
MSEYLLELLLEEMPPADIETILSTLGEKMNLALNGVNVKHGNVEVFATSRRFGFFIHDLSAKQDDVTLKKRGPAEKIAYKDGKPSKALEGFLKSNKASLDEVEIVDVKGTKYVFLNKRVEGKTTSEVLKEIVPGVLSSLQFKRPMRWANGDHKYVRPLHSIISLLDDKVVEFEFLGKVASNQTESHRYLLKELTINTPQEYRKTLKENMVIVDIDERKKMIEDALNETNLDVIKDTALSHEISLITEFPRAVVGNFKEKYATLPEPVLKTVLRHHQRTFVTKENEKISTKFVAFQDGPSKRSSNVRKGYERVINARLEDALFYYAEDTSVPLEKFVSKLDGITFQRGLGTLKDKTDRIIELALDIAKKLNFGDEDLELVKRAAFLSKADVATSMIYEFPELQGIMGRIYASRDEDERVALALEEQHMPDGLEGNAPTDTIGAIVGLADKLDTVVANFAINEIPSGSKDPYGLRKNTFGVLRILNDFEWDINVMEEGSITEEVLKKEVPWKKVEEFFQGRLEVLLKERYSISFDVTKAVLKLWATPLRARLSAQSIEKYKSGEDFEDFITAYTRIHNISGKHDSTEYHVELFEEDEKPLFQAYLRVKPEVEEALEHLNYDEALEKLKSLKPLIDDYFNNVFVMATREDLRRNRLGFLKSLDEIFLKLGNLSLLLKK